MNHLYLFEGLEVRVTAPADPKEQLMFIATDVCAALEIGDTSQAVGNLPEDEKGTCLTRTLGGDQRVLAVTEAGLYRLIFRSRKAAAERFRRWVFHVVLPELRAKGSYTMAPLVSAAPVPRLSLLQYLLMTQPEFEFSPRRLTVLGASLRRLAHALGVRGVLMEDPLLGESLAWPVPFLEFLDNGATAPRLALSNQPETKGDQ